MRRRGGKPEARTRTAGFYILARWAHCKAPSPATANTCAAGTPSRPALGEGGNSSHLIKTDGTPADEPPV